MSSNSQRDTDSQQHSADLPQRRSRVTKDPGKTLNTDVRRFVERRCDYDRRPSYARIRQEIEQAIEQGNLPKLDPAEIPSEGTIAAICRSAPRGEPWSLADASPLQVRLVLPVLAVVIERTEGGRTYITKDEARLIARIRLAARSIPLLTAYEIARQMLWAGREWQDVAILHHFLAFEPWRDNGERYARAYEARWIAHKLAGFGDGGVILRYETPEEADDSEPASRQEGS